MDLSSFALVAGAVFHERYQIVRCLKLGGMGAVYEVRDTKTDSARALKVMLPTVVEDADFRARFALEARVTGGIESDHIVRVSDAGIDDASGAPFLVMDLLRGEELGGLLERVGGLPASDVVLYLHQTALALDKTHAAGIVHRDLKPENLFVTTRDDGSPCVKIFDFGIAKVVAGQQSVRATKALGTPLYMAPEQVRGEGTIGPRADLYALGHIGYSLLVGEPYWEPEAAAIESLFPLMAKIVGGAEEAASERAARRKQVALPRAFDGWFARATATRAEERFERASTLVAALAEALGVDGVAAGPKSRVAAAEPRVVSTTAPTLAAMETPAHAEAEAEAEAGMGAGSMSLQAKSGELKGSERPGAAAPRRSSGRVALGVAAAVVVAAVGVVVVVTSSGQTGSSALPSAASDAPARSSGAGAGAVSLEVPGVGAGAVTVEVTPGASAASAQVAPAPSVTVAPSASVATSAPRPAVVPGVAAPRKSGATPAKKPPAYSQD